MIAVNLAHPAKASEIGVIFKPLWTYSSIMILHHSLRLDWRQLHDRQCIERLKRHAASS